MKVGRAKPKFVLSVAWLGCLITAINAVASDNVKSKHGDTAIKQTFLLECLR